VTPPSGETSKPEPFPLRGLFTRHIVTILITYCMLALQTVSLMALMSVFSYSFPLTQLCATSDTVLLALTSIIRPLFFYTRIRDGGVGFSEGEIGIAMSAYGFVTTGLQFFLFPPLAKWGVARTYRLTLSLYPIIFLGFPMINLIARRSGDGTKTDIYLAVAVALALAAIGNIAYSANMVSRILSTRKLSVSRLLYSAKGTLFCG
jgi:hypothetical protein